MLLHHGTTRIVEGETLNVSPYVQAKNGKDGQWLFATHRFEQAALFSTPWMDCDSFLTTAIDGNPESPLIVFITRNREDYLREIDGRIYSFATDNFERVARPNGELLREWVSASGVPLAKTTMKTIKDVTPLLESGVQMFFTQPHISGRFLNEHLEGKTGDCRPALARYLREHGDRIVWENKRRGINPDRVIDTLATPRLAAPRSAP